MASLERIRSELSQLSLQAENMDISEAKALLYEFVFKLIQEDAGFYVIDTDAGPFCATVGEEDAQLYLRAYTDWELATSRAMPIGGKIVKLQSVEFLRLCKWHFLHGVWGVVLNEEDAAAVLSIPELLQNFLRAVFQDEAAYDEAFVNCVRLISAVRYNSSFKLVCALENGHPNVCVNGKEQGYIYSESDVVLPGGSTELVPVNLQTLFHFQNVVHASLPFAEFCLRARDLSAALKACGISKEDDVYIPAATFYDEPIDVSNPTSGHETISDLRLLFRSEDYETGISTAPKPTTLVPVPDDDEETAEARGIFSQIRLCLDSIAHALNRALAAVRQKLCLLLRSADTAANARKPWIQTIKWHGETGKLAFAAICLIILFTVGIIAWTVEGQRQIARFKEELTSCNYAQAYAMYLQCRNTSAADEAVTESIHMLVTAYARNQIDALALDSGLNALAEYPNQELVLVEAYAVAARLDISKNAYADGASAVSDIEKMKCWVNVIPIDEINYRKVQSEATLHQKKWTAALLGRVENLAYIDRAEAINCARTAEWLYPGNEEIQKWMALFDEEEQKPAGACPIQVQDIRLQHGSDGSIAIYLKWKNLGRHAIESVNFYFRLVDVNGHSVTYQRRGEEIELFCGEESKAAPYEPGFEVSSDTWGWTGLWKGHGDEVDDVVLTCVEVNYRGGSSSVFVTKTDLDRLQA